MHIHPQEKTYATIAIAIVTVFFIAVTISGFSLGFIVPSPESLVDPRTIATPGNGSQYVGFSEPAENRLVEKEAGKEYDLYVTAQMWSFVPFATLPNKELVIKQGAHINFYVTSIDVQHGFMIESTNINMQILPGQVSKLGHTFDKAGSFNLICHEFCGSGHHTMYGTIVVEP
jgi:cytochrome c oxidase subunit 2